MTIRLIYIGRGDALYLVPARDLTDEDFKEYELDEVTLLKSGLYKKVDIDEPASRRSKLTQKKEGE